MKGTMISAAEEVCLMRTRETQGNSVSAAVSEKKLLFRKWFKTRTREPWKRYKECRQHAKKVVFHAKECKRRECWLLHGSEKWSL